MVHANTWHYENDQDQLEIFIAVFEYLHDILVVPSEVVMEDSGKKLLRNVCLHSLLNTDAAVVLLKYVAVGNPTLVSNFIDFETNWFAATDSGVNLLVLNAMRILMQIMKLKETIATDLEVLTPLEQLIYTQPRQRDTLKIIPIVTSYMTYPFNPRFSVLSCKLLRRFAIEFQSSLSACLDMEPDQIRMMFLQRLRDDLESENLKIAVLELVNACVDKQPGLTEAFFKVTYDQTNRNKFFIKRTKESENKCDGILTYMEHYLEAIAIDPTKTTNEQLKKIMNLFHALWKRGLQSLVKDLIKKDNFWPSLCSPLLANPLLVSYQYSQLLKILGIELFKIRVEDKDADNFKKVLESFLTEDVFKRWLNLVFDLPTMDFVNASIGSETPEWLSRLQSFKDFIVVLLHKKTIVRIPSNSNDLLMNRCLQTLVSSLEELENGAEPRSFFVLCELFLILLNDQKSKYPKSDEEDRKLLKQVELLMQTISICYNELHKRAKDSVLAIVIKTLDMESNQINKNELIASGFIRFNVEILCHEFFKLENDLKLNKPFDDSEKHHTIILAITLLKKLLLLNDVHGFAWKWDHSFNQHKLFNRLMSVTSLICQDYSKRLITAELLDLMVLFAKSCFSKDLIHCDIGDYLWMKLLPPKELLEGSTNVLEVSF